MIIKLTDNEWGILEHRLDIYDCIAECYADTMYVEAEDRGEKMTDEQHKAAYAVAYDAGSRLNCDTRNARQIDTDKLSDLDKWILADCLDGTTFFTGIDDAVWDGELTKGKALSLRKAGHSLQRKFNEAGIDCRINWG
jgi:hypothetical protein